MEVNDRVRWTKLELAGVLALCAVALLIRCYNLGGTSTAGDEGYLLDFMLRGQKLSDFVVWCLGDFRLGRQMPLPRISAATFVTLFRLPPSWFAVRLPFAFLSACTILGLWLLGFKVGDRRLAWFLAVVGFVNPYLLFWAKMAHIYAYLLCFVTFSLAFCVGLLYETNAGRRPASRDCLFASVASILACYSHMSAWPATATLWVAVLVFFVKSRGLRGEGAVALYTSFSIYVLALLPWVLIFLFSFGEANRSWHSYAGAQQWRELSMLPFNMMWGGRVPRSLFSLALPVVGLVGGWSRRRSRFVVLVSLVYGIVVFSAIAAMQYLGLRYIGLVRYYMPIWPCLMLWSALGILVLGEAVARIPRIQWLRPMQASVGIAVVLVALMVRPMIWTVSLPGNPTPYDKVNAWMDENLPKGAPVLVDRWFEPWCEMRLHGPTNVTMTFTIPDEPLETFKKYNWRGTARDFFTKFPDAAYMEMTKHYFTIPEVGYWHWPREFFRRHVAITNEQALKLCRIDLMPRVAFRDSPYYTNRVIVEVFHNLPEDRVEIDRQRGKKVSLWYGEGWGYTKLWRQRKGDFRDWRVLSERALLDLHNVTDAPLDATLRFTAVAPQSRKQVLVGSHGGATFVQGKIMRLDIGPIPLQPGKNSIWLTDPGWGKAHSPLLVSLIEAVPSPLSVGR